MDFENNNQQVMGIVLVFSSMFSFIKTESCRMKKLVKLYGIMLKSDFWSVPNW